MSLSKRCICVVVLAGMATSASVALAQSDAPGRPATELWAEGKVAFGVFVPNEAQAQRPPGAPPAGPPAGPRTPPVYTVAGGERLAMNPLYDFVFLNLEGRYDAGAIAAIAKGLRSPKAVSRKTLLVRIPSIEDAGAEATRARIKEAFALGADGVTLPHVRSVEEAKLALSFFQEATTNIWSPANPKGDKVAMLMVEDPDAVAQAPQIANLPGYTVLACGIGSLTAALAGDRAAAEAGTQRVLAESMRAGLVNMLTASPQDVEKRVAEGFTALLGMGPAGDEMIRIGRKAAGR